LKTLEIWGGLNTKNLLRFVLKKKWRRIQKNVEEDSIKKMQRRI
jgi:hypothetical protein